MYSYFFHEMNPPYRGLNNLGSTCYLNSCLQAISASHSLKRAILNVPSSDEAEKRVTDPAYAQSDQPASYDTYTASI